MTSHNAKDIFLSLLLGENVEDAPGCIPRNCFSCKVGSEELLSSSLTPTPVADGLEYELAPGLVLHLVINKFEGYPTVELIPIIENRSDKKSPVISDFASLDIRGTLPEYYDVMKLKSWHLHAGGAMRVRANLGSQSVPTDFFPADRILYARTGMNHFEMTTNEGRPSATFLPFFGIDFDEAHGVNISVGWSGSWRASASIDTKTGDFPNGLEYRVTTSMLETSFALEPGERVTLPSILLQFRSEMSVVDAQNIHRRLLREHFSPRDADGKIIKPPVSFCTWGGQDTPGLVDRANLIRKNNLPYEVYWIDAGWMGADAPCPHFLEDSEYKSDWPSRVGSWNINRFAHPDGLRPISKAVHEAGMTLMVWFEMERVHKNSGAEVLTEHPDWLLSSSARGDSYLLDLGNPDACEWITKLIGDYLEREGIDHLRVDFNINTLSYWRENDASDRIGINEIRYVEGLRKFWAAIRKRFPNLFIDNCASGGRRLDYSLAKYSFPLCQSDFATFGEYQFTCVQLENYYLSSWMPLHASLQWYPDVTDAYATFSTAGAATGFGDKIWQFNGRYPKEDHPMDIHRRYISLAVRLRDIQMEADYYPLTPNAERLENWCASQFHNPDKDEGYLIAFRRTETLTESETFKLNHIKDDATYTLEHLDGSKEELSGSTLRAYTISLPPHSVEIVIYSRR